MPDELDEYDEEIDSEEAVVGEQSDERLLADADELFNGEAEPDETPFDVSRVQYSGVAEGDDDVDVEEYEDAGARFDDPEKTVLLEGGMDDPDGSEGWS